MSADRFIWPLYDPLTILAHNLAMAGALRVAYQHGYVAGALRVAQRLHQSRKAPKNELDRIKAERFAGQSANSLIVDDKMSRLREALKEEQKKYLTFDPETMQRALRGLH